MSHHAPFTRVVDLPLDLAVGFWLVYSSLVFEIWETARARYRDRVR